MAMLVFTVVAAVVLVVAYAVGIGGTLGTLLAFTVLFTGALLRVAAPLLEKLKP